LVANESWRLKDLLDFSLVVSSNDGARSIASAVGAFDLKSDDYDLGRKDFITKMNKTAQDLGLKQTYFVNESGLDVGSVSGGYGSAIDVAALMQYILVHHPEVLEATKYPTLDIKSFDAKHVAKNTNTDIGDIPGLIASKTGYTELAGGNLAIVFDSSIGRPIIVVVLGSTQEGRFADVSALVNASLTYIQESQP
jgi:serine-type D-Ala-D-Ala carboxypeptidase (penicillin-binding protein 5/6)